MRRRTRSFVWSWAMITQNWYLSKRITRKFLPHLEDLGINFPLSLVQKQVYKKDIFEMCASEFRNHHRNWLWATDFVEFFSLNADPKAGYEYSGRIQVTRFWFRRRLRISTDRISKAPKLISLKWHYELVYANFIRHLRNLPSWRWQVGKWPSASARSI